MHGAVAWFLFLLQHLTACLPRCTGVETHLRAKKTHARIELLFLLLFVVILGVFKIFMQVVMCGSEGGRTTIVVEIQHARR
jgi:hypothetical protein